MAQRIVIPGAFIVSVGLVVGDGLRIGGPDLIYLSEAPLL